MLIVPQIGEFCKMGDPNLKNVQFICWCILSKLLMLLDNVEQSRFDWFEPMWKNHRERHHMTKRFPTISKLTVEMEYNIAKYVKLHSSFHILPTLMSTPKFLRHSCCCCSYIIGRPWDCLDHLQSMKLRSTRKVRGLRQKANGGQLVCIYKMEGRQADNGAWAH